MSVSENELAVFAYNAYRPSPENRIDVPTWIRNDDLSIPDRGSGFDGSVFVKTSASGATEVVISFRGTDADALPTLVSDWVNGNILAAAGYEAPQVLRAIELIADTIATYPAGTQITLTGHSLGGGLASLMAAFFGLDAHIFDPAPFELSAIGQAILPPTPVGALPLLIPTDLVERYFDHDLEYQQRQNRTGPAQVSSAFQQYREVLASENLNAIEALLTQRETGIKGDYLDGESLEVIRTALPTIVSSAPNDLHEIDVGETTLEGDGKLHSMLLLTALRISSALQQASSQHPALLALLLDEALYASDRNATTTGFLNRLITEQMREGVEPGQGMLDRFAQDALRLATTGTTNHQLIRDALMATMSVAMMIDGGPYWPWRLIERYPLQVVHQLSNGRDRAIQNGLCVQ